MSSSGSGEHLVELRERRDAGEIHLLAGGAEVALDVGPVAGRAASR